MLNQEIARIFYEIADILEMRNVEWKPRAYRKAALALEGIAEDVGDLYRKGGIKALDNIPGVGQRLARKIEECIKTGRIREYERLKGRTPKGLEQLMEVMGLGPKKVTFLYKRLGIKTIAQLERAVKQHRLRGIKGFGEKTEENIANAIELFKKGKERMPLGLAYTIAHDIIQQLKALKEVDRISMAGSLRRMSETIGDIDILVSSKKPEAVMNRFVKLQDVTRVVAEGPTKGTILLKTGVQADIRILPPGNYGSALQYFTGNKQHNIKLRKIAITKGYKLSEYGLFIKKTNRRVAGRTEEEIYRKLGLPYIEPELREDTGEIEAAMKNKLPRLITLADVKGDLHVHSKWSDGSDDLEDIAKAAIQRGYSYICIADHSKSNAIAHGLSEERLLEQVAIIKRLNKRLKGLRIFTGSEVDIKADGTLDYDDSILRKLDIVMVSVHTAFKMSKRQMTERVEKALGNRHVHILSHPTGRIINKRDPYVIDLEQIFSVAKEKKKFLEINAQQNRLDLNGIHARSAIEHGVRLAISTDAHSVEHLRFMELGVAQARRGWAEKKDIINTLDLKDMVRMFGID